MAGRNHDGMPLAPRGSTPGHGKVGWLVAIGAIVGACAQASGTGGVPDAEPEPLPMCGNGRMDPGEVCDDGNTDDTDDCVGMCVVASCGDGFVQASVEACDDGNTIDDDGCTNACEGWQYRVPITFDAPAAETGVPILVVLDASSFSYANAAAGGSDLRLGIDDDASNGFEVPYWIESWNASGASLVWALVPSVAAGSNTIWAFYGYSAGTVATTGDFATTFPDTLRTTDSINLGGAVSHDAVIIEAGHTVTVTAGAALAISAAYVRIDGTINADAAGHAGSAGPGPGGASADSGGGGGGHGGAGGAGGQDAGDTPGGGGAAQGDAMSEAIAMGSGGGATDVSAGGRGGGAVEVTARHIVVPGTITADGQIGQGSPRSGGGGAGGGVLLRASSISFTGSISVDGGSGGSGPDTVNDGGGGGGGGRIKLLHGGLVVETGTTTQAGGAGGQFGDATIGRVGAPGTYHAGTSSTLPPLPVIGAEQRL